MSVVRRIILGLILPIALVGVWAVMSAVQPSIYFPPPGKVAVQFFTLLGSNFTVVHLLPSLLRMFAGFFIALLIGVASGVLLGMSNIAHAATKPWLTLLRSIPGPTVVVMFLVLFGTGSLGQILMIAFAAVFPVLLNTIDGVRSVNPVLKEMARSYRLSWTERVTRIVLPGALPQIAVGVRTSLALAFVVMIISEYFGGSDGIGYFTRDSGASFMMSNLWAGMLMLGVLGIVLNALVVAMQRRSLRWYIGSRAIADEA